MDHVGIGSDFDGGGGVPGFQKPRRSDRRDRGVAPPRIHSRGNHEDLGGQRNAQDSHRCNRQPDKGESPLGASPANGQRRSVTDCIDPSVLPKCRRTPAADAGSLGLRTLLAGMLVSAIFFGYRDCGGGEYSEKAQHSRAIIRRLRGRPASRKTNPPPNASPLDRRPKPTARRSQHAQIDQQIADRAAAERELKMVEQFAGTAAERTWTQLGKRRERLGRKAHRN